MLNFISVQLGKKKSENLKEKQVRVRVFNYLDDIFISDFLLFLAASFFELQFFY